MRQFSISLSVPSLLLSLSLCLGSVACSPTTITPPQANTLQAQREPVSALMGDPPNFAASSNGSLLAMVSGQYGRGAKAGALVELYFKDLGEEHLWDAYNGLSYEGSFSWLHDLTLLKQYVEPETDIVVSQFSGPEGRFIVETSDVVLRDRDVLARQIKITNTGPQTLSSVRNFFYENLTVNLFPTGDHCEYLPDRGALHHYENLVHFAIGLNQAPTQFQCGGVKNYLTRAFDAMDDAQDGQLHGNGKASAYAGLGVNGTLAGQIFDLMPGQSHQELQFIAAGTSSIESLENLRFAQSLNWEQIKNSNSSFWQQFLQNSKIPAGLSPDELRVYQRALMVMKQHSAPTGAHIAAPTTFNTVYRFSWPRDGSYISLAHLRSGHPEESRRFLEFMASVQKSNGGWGVNFHTNGQPFLDFGDRKNEHDQVGTIPWMMVEYANTTGDLNWLKQQWPVIQKACDFLMRFTDARTGLMGPTRDLWELSTSDSWTYSNAAAYAGFKAGAEAAHKLGFLDAAERYTLAAEQLKTAIETYLWNAKGHYFVRGLNLDSLQQDPKVEAANLALAWPFGVFSPEDPRMQDMAQAIQSGLSSGRGGISRYTGDAYYDGQPWPVTTEWLSIYYSLIGRTDAAKRLHDTVTGYAMSTQSHQLGEQFDEAKGRWVSALPLTWSGAKYILAAQALSDPNSFH